THLRAWIDEDIDRSIRAFWIGSSIRQLGLAERLSHCACPCQADALAAVLILVGAGGRVDLNEPLGIAIILHAEVELRAQIADDCELVSAAVADTPRVVCG